MALSEVRGMGEGQDCGKEAALFGPHEGPRAQGQAPCWEGVQASPGLPTRKAPSLPLSPHHTCFVSGTTLC